MNIESTAFGQNQVIPAKYTCDGKNVNPPLLIYDIPPGTQSLTLIMDDPDAPQGTFTHWLLWDIPYDTAEISKEAVLPGIESGTNSAGRTGYTGPCPPSGEHRYFFRLYALDTRLGLPSGTDQQTLEKEMEGHIINEAELIGRYSR